MSRPDEEVKRASRSVWGETPAGSTHAPGLEPGTKEFFEKVLRERFGQELRFLERSIPFAATVGRQVLEIGCGMGYDGYQFCKAGADYVGLDLTPENAERAHSHLRSSGFESRLLAGDAEHLPLGGDTFDFVYSFGVLHHTPEFGDALRETKRVLKPGGTFWLLVYNRNSVFYLLQVVLATYILRGRFLNQTLEERRSEIEYSTSEDRPLVRLYTRRSLRKHLRAAGFEVERLTVAKLNPEDFPALPFLESRLWEKIPNRVLDLLAKRVGWYLVATARKR